MNDHKNKVKITVENLFDDKKIELTINRFSDLNDWTDVFKQWCLYAYIVECRWLLAYQHIELASRLCRQHILVGNGLRYVYMGDE